MNVTDKRRPKQIFNLLTGLEGDGVDMVCLQEVRPYGEDEYYQYEGIETTLLQSPYMFRTPGPLATIRVSAGPCLSWCAQRRRLRLRDVAEEAIGQMLMGNADSIVRQLADVAPTWCLKGGGAVWWTTLHIYHRPWASRSLKSAIDKLGLLVVRDLDFTTTTVPEATVECARMFSARLKQTIDWSNCNSWFEERNCRCVRQPFELSFEQATSSILGVSPGPLATSLHHGTNGITGEEYQLLRMAIVAQHRRGFHIRVPCIDVNLSKNTLPPNVVINGVRVVTLVASRDDVVRMVFVDTDWQPWRSELQGKVQRRLQRLVGLTLLLCHPSPTPWARLSLLLEFVFACESQLLDWDRRATLRELRHLYVSAPEAFKVLCAHLHIALSPTCGNEHGEVNEDYVAYLDFLMALKSATNICSKV